MARLMSSTELYQCIKDENRHCTLVDLRSKEDCTREHIPSAISIPLDELSQRATGALNKNQRVIVYGDTHLDDQSGKAANILEDMGFRKVADFDGGIEAWKSAGYITEEGDEAKKEDETLG